ncbi:pre-mRNA-splicing factor cwc24 [Arabidopsis lyrata subsp. lyrata]|uniref:pre-mRNA-splicing factor cwc24 n=1 Tax=Arabidopsis lyrata subsp. lyrata TaxID=81972 RepID=UPI000A29B060|nr:pre-mRNA-splicing factor cwc24 [Arabidopsis lyrata subsp. lyrata]|eukprot:XP_020877998.1 pre-mRNA-splicing factor cwc24 [Arabidopsis lyrata subsp. lyrata]
MSDSGEAKTSEEESQLAEQETETREDEMTKNLKKRGLDVDKDEDSKNESSRLEKLEKKVKKATSRKLETDFEPTEENDALPLACSICKKPFMDPVVTKCNHYFCDKCALKHQTENDNCFVCNEPTLGVFNTAVEIKERIDEEREKARAMVKEVRVMLEKASTMADGARGISEKAVKMVEEIERMVEKVAAMATKAAETATMAADMVQEAEETMETAKANMAKAFAVMKTVMWNV